jgi:threonine dehydratase
MNTPIRPPEASATAEAAERIAPFAIKTPMVKLNWERPDCPGLEIWLKLENLQPVNSFKIRGASNAILKKCEERGCGKVVVNTHSNNLTVSRFDFEEVRGEGGW